MNFLSLSFPGDFLNLADQASCREGERLIAAMKHAFIDAVASLSLYQAAQSRQSCIAELPLLQAEPALPAARKECQLTLSDTHPSSMPKAVFSPWDTIGKVLAIMSASPSFPDATTRKKSFVTHCHR